MGPVPKFLQVHSPLIALGGLMIFAPLIEGGTTHMAVFIMRIVLLAVLTGWVWGALKAERLVVRRSPLFLLIAVFAGWAVLSVVRSVYVAAGLQWLISLFSYAVLLFLVLQLVESISQVRVFVKVVLCMGLAEAALGLYQFLGEGKARATGTFFNPNFFASYEVAIFAVAFGLLCFRRADDEARWNAPLLWLTAGGSMCGFILAQSRGALLAFVSAAAFVGIYRFGRAFVGVLVVVLLAGVLIPNPLQKRVLTIVEHDPYAMTRLDIWKNSIERIADHPWGVGPGLYKYTSFQYRFPIENAITRYGKRAESAHSEYLQMGVELGAAGLALFLVGLALLAWEVRQALRCPLKAWERGLVVGLAGGILGLLVHAAVDSVFHEPALVLLGTLFAGMILVLKRLSRPETASVRVMPFPFHPARAAMVGVLVTLMAVLIIRPAAAWHAFDQGERAMTVGRLDQAVAWYQWALRMDPGMSVYHDAMAFWQVRFYQQSGDHRWLSEAVSELKVALDLNPLDARLAKKVGDLLRLLAEQAATRPEREAFLEEAATYYEQAIKLDPYSPFNYLELGNLRWTQGRLDEAKGWFRLATSYEPNFLPARVRLAELALQMGRKGEAVLEFAGLVSIKERHRGQVLNTLERQYLEVESDHLQQALRGPAVP